MESYQKKYFKYKTKYLYNKFKDIQNGGATIDEQKKLLESSEYLFNYFSAELEDVIPLNFYRRHINDLSKLKVKNIHNNFHEYNSITKKFINLGKYKTTIKDQNGLIELTFDNKSYKKTELLKNNNFIYEEFNL